MKKLLFIVLVLTMTLSLSCFQIFVPDGSSPGTTKPAGGKQPVAYIDSVQPTTAAQNNAVVFNGHGTDTDGTIIGYEWRSSIDGIISTAPSFTSTSLSTGTHSISFRVLDNTSQWSAAVNSSITITPKAANPVIETFVIVPNSIIQGNSVELRWNVSGAKSASIDNGVGPVAATGFKQIYPIATQSFTLTAVNDNGSTSKTASVTVQQSTTASDPVVSFTAQHLGGNSWRLNWTVQNATQIVIDPEIGSVNPVGTRDVTVPSGQTKLYRLTARNNWGGAYWQVFLTAP
jgi:hypothetical protein